MYTSYQSIYSVRNNQQTVKNVQHRFYRRQSRRLRRMIVTALFILMLFIACGSIVQAWTQDKNEDHAIYKEVIVMNGDTLWDIAKQYLPYDMDIRDYVNEIAKHNHIRGGFLMAGEVIEIPIYNKASR